MTLIIHGYIFVYSPNQNLECSSSMLQHVAMALMRVHVVDGMEWCGSDNRVVTGKEMRSRSDCRLGDVQ